MSQGFGGLELQRSAWSDADRQRFQQLAREDGFYRLRLRPGGGKGGHVLTSLRARCLVASGFEVIARSFRAIRILHRLWLRLRSSEVRAQQC